MARANLPSLAAGSSVDPLKLTAELQAAFGRGNAVYVLAMGDHLEVVGITDAELAQAQAVINKHGGQVDPYRARRDRIRNATSFADLQAAMLQDYPADMDGPVPARNVPVPPQEVQPTSFPVPEPPPRTNEGSS